MFSPNPHAVGLTSNLLVALYLPFPLKVPVTQTNPVPKVNERHEEVRYYTSGHV